MNDVSLTELECSVAHKLAEAWNLFLLLPAEHPDEINEMRAAIHAAQGLILSRTGRRQINSRQTSPKGDPGYIGAFYDLAKMMGIGACAKSPRDVWEHEMLPRLQALFSNE
jgi:hypothetical protein